MKERSKSFLLILLVGISILFIKRLWIEEPSKTVDIFSNNKETYSSSYLLIDMIAPNKYLLNFNEMNHTLIYDEFKYNLWENSKNSLSKALGSKKITIENLEKEELSKYNSKRSIACNFPEKINTDILAKALNVKRPNNIMDTLPNIDTIYMYLGSGDPFFIFSNEDKSIIVYDKSIDTTKTKESISSIEDEKNIIIIIQ